jgi:hypothetical protein
MVPTPRKVCTLLLGELSNLARSPGHLLETLIMGVYRQNGAMTHDTFPVEYTRMRPRVNTTLR